MDNLAEKYQQRIAIAGAKNLVDRFDKAGVDPDVDRWSLGIPHHPKSETLVRELVDVDFVFFNDYFGWKVGGDGDNGETLMYMLDVLFDLHDKEAEKSND